MRFRFSIRTLLLITTMFAAACYYCIVLPSAMARRFVSAINTERYPAADHMFWHDADRTFAKWKDERWGFACDAELASWSVRQFLCGRRNVVLRMKYFQFDENHYTAMELAATSFGMQSPQNTSDTTAMLFDRTDRFDRPKIIIERR